MGLVRKPFQGVLNIVRFNWHFYLIAIVVLSLSIYLKNGLNESFQLMFLIGIILAFITIVTSLIVSYYIFDVSDLYSLPWLREVENKCPKRILNINAGFDETSNYLSTVFPGTKLDNCDFYNPEKHTEVSIERARKKYPSNKNTIQVETNKFPFEDNAFDIVTVFMAAHEVRNEVERVLFFEEINRVSSDDGKIFVTEHMRDANNFLAFTFGFFHFYSRSLWVQLFRKTNFNIIKQVKTTPFVTTFILSRNGTAH